MHRISISMACTALCCLYGTTARKRVPSFWQSGYQMRALGAESSLTVSQKKALGLTLQEHGGSRYFVPN